MRPTPGTSYSGWNSCSATLAPCLWTTSASALNVGIWASVASLGVSYIVIGDVAPVMTASPTPIRFPGKIILNLSEQ